MIDLRGVALLHLSWRARFTLTLISLLSACDLSTGLPPQALPKPDQRAYVWRDISAADLQRASQETPSLLQGLDLLMSTSTWDERGAVKVRPQAMNLRALSKLSSLGAVLRVELPSKETPLAPLQDALAQQLSALKAQQTRAQVAPFDVITIDFDAPTRRLKEYAEVLKGLRELARPARLSVTVLIDHTKSPALELIAEQVDHITLQLHSLEPAQGAPERPLLEPLVRLEESRAAIARIEALRHPYRVSLPTYGYLVILNHHLGFKRVLGEVEWPITQHLERVLLSRPEAISQLAQDLITHTRSPYFEGLSWYRLPSQRQRVTWGWPTFRAVLKGEPLRSALRVCVEQREGDWAPSEPNGLMRYALFAHNQGNLDWAWRRALKVSVSRGALSEPQALGELHAALEEGSLIVSQRTQAPFEHLSSRAQLAARLKAGGPPQLIAEVSVAQGDGAQWRAQLFPQRKSAQAGAQAAVDTLNEDIAVVPCEELAP